MTNKKKISGEQRIFLRLKKFFGALGPGFITGASDDDPSGIGTYSQTGAQFGYTQLWTALFTFPLMTIVQEICARIGLQTGMGLAGNLRKYYPRPVLYGCVALLFLANTINIGADLGAMAAMGKMVAGIPFILSLLAITLITIVLEVFISYKRYARFLRFLALSLFAYVFVAFVIPQDWRAVLRNTLIPTIRFRADYWLNFIAIFGTTISPYLFFWQASEEVEEDIEAGKKTVSQRLGATGAEIKIMRTDVTLGMLFSNVVMWFIIITTASTLFRHGITNIDTAPKAALALRPIAGQFAYILFALGIIGTGLLAIPILAGSSAYAAAEALRFREGLSMKLREAPGFYGVIALSTCIGAVINFFGINPITALYYTAVLNGVVAPPLLVMVMLIGGNSKIMKDNTNGRLSYVLGWATTAIMTIATVAFFITEFLTKK